ncbi:MAG: HU family DNA-binding protein [Desulfobacterales bacterium]|nr:HU family DNA-binding protein [Desulfobacterales bacterium]
MKCIVKNCPFPRARNRIYCIKHLDNDISFIPRKNITFTGFGSFKVVEKAARKGINPQTKNFITTPTLTRKSTVSKKIKKKSIAVKHSCIALHKIQILEEPDETTDI